METPTQTPPAQEAPPAAPTPGGKKLPLNLSKGQMIIGIAGILTVIGSLLPWVKIMGMISIAGTDGDGMVTLIAGALAIVAIFIKKIPIWVTLLIGVLVLGVMGYDGYKLYDSSSGAEMGDFAGGENPFGGMDLVSIGIGAYMTVVGGIGIVVGAIMEMKKKA